MGLIEVEAIILRVIKYSENSLICDALTSEYGKVSLIASKGSKRNQSIPNHLRIMNMVQITYYPSKNNNLHRLKEVNFTHMYKTINLDVKKSLIGTLLAEIVLNLMKEDYSDRTTLFGFLKSNLIFLDSEDCDGLEYLIEILIHILSIEGILPINNYSDLNTYFNVEEGMFQSFEILKNGTLSKERSIHLNQSLQGLPLKLTADKINTIEDILTYFSMHLPQFKGVKSWEIIKELHL
jgi:DNA repair protein RecO (recombination protein O)